MHVGLDLMYRKKGAVNLKPQIVEINGKPYLRIRRDILDVTVLLCQTPFTCHLDLKLT